jgi:hypothetical protein
MSIYEPFGSIWVDFLGILMYFDTFHSWQQGTPIIGFTGATTAMAHQRLILAVGGDESRCKGRSLQTCTDETM